jgi:asparagine synthase (glutamine-hydrolysing)
MCGIAGAVHSRPMSEASLVSIGVQMGDAMTHRGPDDKGVWYDLKEALVLSFRRLAIIDLSEAGHQPIVSSCERFVLLFNGEIYNHLSLRKELPKLWRGHSDSETLVEALSCWGIERTLKRLDGMFAFSLYDRKERKLFLARDRMGEKPLFYGNNSGKFMFGSELKALRAHVDWKGEVDPSALGSLLQRKYVAAPGSIYKGIRKLKPAHYVEYDLQSGSIGEQECYWHLGERASEGLRTTLNMSDQELLVHLKEQLRDSVRSRMATDVPLGAFLSGGVDSSLVVSIMQELSSDPVRTFSIGFHEDRYNEAGYARKVAEHLGTNHTELYIDTTEALEVIPDLPRIWDEPFADSSQIPTYLVSRLARENVTVSLSGDGGDELFCGYDRYFRAKNIANVYRYVPGRARRLMGEVLSKDFVGSAVENLLGKDSLHLQDRLPKLGRLLSKNSSDEMYASMISNCDDLESLLRLHPGVAEHALAVNSLPGDIVSRMMLMDQREYLPNDILVKLDRASMACGLEARVPLLSNSLVELSWQLPERLKYRGKVGKWGLKQILRQYIPTELVHRPKMGFGVPIEKWLRTDLRDWAESQLSESRLQQEGFFHTETVRTIWDEHMTGKRRWHAILWNILAFQSWLETT